MRQRPGPADRRLRPLHLRVQLRHGRVVGRRDGPFERLERRGRVQPDALDALRVGAAGRRQRVARQRDGVREARVVEHDVADRARADVARAHRCRPGTSRRGRSRAPGARRARRRRSAASRGRRRRPRRRTRARIVAGEQVALRQPGRPLPSSTVTTGSTRRGVGPRRRSGRRVRVEEQPLAAAVHDDRACHPRRVRERRAGERGREPRRHGRHRGAAAAVARVAERDAPGRQRGAERLLVRTVRPWSASTMLPRATLMPSTYRRP